MILHGRSAIEVYYPQIVGNSDKDAATQGPVHHNKLLDVWLPGRGRCLNEGFAKGAPDRPAGEPKAITRNNLVAAVPHDAEPGWDWQASDDAYPAVMIDQRKRGVHGCAPCNKTLEAILAFGCLHAPTAACRHYCYACI